MKEITVLSLFDGMSCGQIALERAGVKVKAYYASEIKPHAIKVTQYNYPNTIQLGDVTKWHEWDIDWSSIDLVIGGSPCQSFSVAGNGDGFNGKSGLFFEFADIVHNVILHNPKALFLLENVVMKKEWQDIISKIMGVQPIRIDSDLVCAALRKRLYWTNIEGVGVPKDKNILLSDILEYGYNDKLKARCLMESDSRPLSTPIKMVHRYFTMGFPTLIFKSEEHFKQCKEHYYNNYKGLPAKEIKYNGEIYDGVRYPSRNEREILQTLPLNYTSILSERKRQELLAMVGL